MEFIETSRIKIDSTTAYGINNSITRRLIAGDHGKKVIVVTSNNKKTENTTSGISYGESQRWMTALIIIED